MPSRRSRTFACGPLTAETRVAILESVTVIKPCRHRSHQDVEAWLVDISTTYPGKGSASSLLNVVNAQ